MNNSITEFGNPQSSIEIAHQLWTTSQLIERLRRFLAAVEKEKGHLKQRRLAVDPFAMNDHPSQVNADRRRIGIFRLDTDFECELGTQVKLPTRTENDPVIV